MMARFGKYFCEDIRQLVMSRDMRQSYLLSDNMLTDEVAINLNVLRPFIKERIVGNFGSTGIVPIKRCRVTNTNSQFTKETA
ncbi:hypothetical protein AAC387_Pa02g0624 [Persea americana]